MAFMAFHEPSGHGLGWRPELPDFRDHHYGVSAHGTAELAKARPVRAAAPRFYDLRIKDQRQIGSCTGQAWSREAQREHPMIERSPLAIYYEERRLNNETDIDNGAYIRDGAKVVTGYGTPQEKLWPDVDENVFKDPPAKVDRNAAAMRFGEYLRVGPSLDEMCAVINSGHGFVMGISCYDSMFTPIADATGIIPYPQPSEALQGGHALEYGAYDLEFKQSEKAYHLRNDKYHGLPEEAIPAQVLIFANSWNPQWGDAGYGYLDMRFAVNENLADDRWTIRWHS
jgi:hypothetical protein